MTQAATITEPTPPPTPAEPAVADAQIEELAAKLFKADEPTPTVDPATESAEPAPAETAPAEETTEEPAPAENPRVAARIAAATRAEIAAAKERAALRAEKDSIERAKAELESERKRFKLLEEDPVKAFEVLKLDPKTFLEKLSGEYKPENVQAREVAALKAELEELKTGIARSQETAKQRAEREAAEQTFQQAAKGFIAHVGETAEKYPHLVAEFTEQEAVNEAYRALHEVVGQDDDGKPVTRNEAYFRQFGSYPDDDVIAEHLDQLAKQRAEARQNSAWRKKDASATNGSQPLSIGDPNPKAPPVNKGPSPRTLTSRAASEKAASPKEMTQQERDALSLKLLEKAFIKEG